MRNTTLAWRIAQDEGIAPAFVILYAESPELPFPTWLASGGFEKFRASLRQDQIVCRAVSYQALIRSARPLEHRGAIRPFSLPILSSDLP
jgi:hypothetical protein